MLVISIDGACRRNGKPDCVAAAGVFVQEYNEENKLGGTRTLTNYETGSTNQRGELLALITALDHIAAVQQHSQIVTDSEYLFNTMTKEWLNTWYHTGWLTAADEPVKNQDLWEQIYDKYVACTDIGIDIMFYHIKGHCISFGKVTANNLLNKNENGLELMAEVLLKYDEVKDNPKAKQQLLEANELSEKNNGFKLDPEYLCLFVVANVIADAVATRCVDAADALM